MHVPLTQAPPVAHGVPSAIGVVIHPATGSHEFVVQAFQLVRGKQAFTDPPAHRRRGRILLALLSVTVATGSWLYVATFA